LFNGVKAAIGRSITNLVTKYDQNWFVRFMNIANREDMAAGVSAGDSMKNHAWVNIAVWAIAKNIARAPFELMSGDDVVEAGKEYELFKFVNPYMSRFQLWEATVSWLKYRGESIWLYNDDHGGTGIPREIYPVDPTRFEHIVDKRTNRIALWKYTPPGSETFKGNEITFTPDELLHFHVWNPWNEWRGVNPMTSCGYEVNQDILANRNNTSLLRNRSIPDGLLTSDKSMSEEQAKDTKDRWRKQHQGVNRAYDIAVLGHGMKYTPLQIDSTKMQHFELKKWNRNTILAKYGVLPAVVGVKDDLTPMSGSDTKEQMRAFWTMTLVPEIHHIEDKLRTDFFGKIGSKLEGRFNIDAIPELQENEDEKYKRYGEAVGKGLMTQNEAREKLGFEDPVPWGDVWWHTMGLRPYGDEISRQAPPPGQPPELPPKKEFFVSGLSKVCEPEEKELALPPALPAPTTKTHELYTEMYKLDHWWKMAKQEEAVEEQYKKEVKQWFFDQRSRNLRLLADKAKAVKEPDFEWMQTLRDVKDEMLEERYWLDQEQALKAMSQKYFIMGMEFTGGQLVELFKDLGMDVSESFSVYQTGALEKLTYRVNQGNLAKITDTVRSALSDRIGIGISEGQSVDEIATSIRDVYNVAQNRAETIARTEMGGVINETRVEGFKEVGFERHSWLSARDDSVRELHQIDGEIVKIDEYFSNGLRYPNDIDGAAENVIRCRCTVLPEE